jgi:hypothetical protein
VISGKKKYEKIHVLFLVCFAYSYNPSYAQKKGKIARPECSKYMSLAKKYKTKQISWLEAR